MINTKVKGLKKQKRYSQKKKNSRLSAYIIYILYACCKCIIIMSFGLGFLAFFYNHCAVALHKLLTLTFSGTLSRIESDRQYSLFGLLTSSNGRHRHRRAVVFVFETLFDTHSWLLRISEICTYMHALLRVYSRLNVCIYILE